MSVSYGYHVNIVSPSSRYHVGIVSLTNQKKMHVINLKFDLKYNYYLNSINVDTFAASVCAAGVCPSIIKCYFSKYCLKELDENKADKTKSLKILNVRFNFKSNYGTNYSTNTMTIT